MIPPMRGFVLWSATVRVLMVMMIAGISGCAPRILTPAIPPLNLHEIDTTPLKGKRIVVDPGHGGVFTGAIGLGGLRESDVNLAVGLDLWGLLKEAGADPVLTRSADVSRISPDSRELKADLQARVDAARRYEPDLFISLHHNSDINRRGRNETEIYYQMANPGASRDLAEALAGTFGNRMGAEDIRLLPGNFYVLRHSPATAILGESSFMSNRPNERRLSLYGYLRLEAEAYFLGILEYFRKGIPLVVYPLASRENDGVEPPSLEEGEPLEATLSDSGGGGIDPVSLAASLDDLPVPFRFDPDAGRVSYLSPVPLSNGPHTFRVQGANRNGMKTPVKDLTFRVARPPAIIHLSLPFSEIPPDGETLSRIEIRVEDIHGLPVADGTPIRLTLTSGNLLSPDLTVRDGMAVGHLRAPVLPGEGILRGESGEAAAEVVLRFVPPSQSLLYGVVTDPKGNPVEGVGMTEEGGLIDLSDREGFLFYQGSAGEHRF
ncbi:MAG: N-acetylmuramoyl-L-alanine amidase, partial [Nitrospirae bacterium]|nr:N-acetylmuramoyl-L-alanine amidase [Nitrospirota bacterium]